MRECLKISIPQIDKLFPDIDFSQLMPILDQYDEEVQKHYKEFVETNKAWNKVKNSVYKLGEE